MTNSIIRVSFITESVENTRIIESLIGGENFEIVLAKLEKVLVVRVTDPTLISEFNSIKIAISKANSNRGKYIHSHWLNNTDLSKFLFSLPGRLQAVVHDIPAIQALLEELKAESDRLASETKAGIAQAVPIRTKLKRNMNERTKSMRESETNVPIEDLVEAVIQARTALRDFASFMHEVHKYVQAPSP